MNGAQQFLRARAAFLIMGGALAAFSCKAGKALPEGGGAAPYLRSLEFDYPLALNPAFSPGRYDYQVELPGEIPQLRVKAESAPGCSASFVSGEYFMPRHGALAVVRVTAADSRAVNYVISFSQPDAARPLPPAKLAGLEFSPGALPDFSPDTYDYTVEVPFGVSRITAVAAGVEEGSYLTYTPAMSVEMTDGMGRLAVGVAADGFAPSAYTVTFAAAKPRVSELAAVSLSTGTITTRDGEEARFTGEAVGEQYIAVPKDTRRLLVYADKKNTADRVRFTIDGEIRGGESCVIADPRSLDGKEFSITVNNGVGFSDREYRFRLYTVEKTAALLENISVSGGTLWQREDDGGDGASFFLARTLLYNVNFAHGAEELTIRASAPEGMTVRINERETGVETVRNPSATSPPARIAVHAPGMLTTVYVLYFVKTNPPADTEASVRVEGGPDRTAADYTLGVRREEAQLPRLIALKAGGRTIALEAARLVYEAVVAPEGAAAEAEDLPFDWAVDESEVKRVQYSLDGGESWREDADKDGFSGALSLLPGRAAVVLVKIITYDGNAAVYAVKVRREKGPVL